MYNSQQAQGMHGMYQQQAQGQQQPRFQTVNVMSQQTLNMQQMNRPVNFGDQRQNQMQWRATPAFSGGDQKAIEAADKVKIKSLPFYEIKHNLIKQCCLVAQRMVPADPRSQKPARCEAQLDFGLTVQQCATVCASREVVKATNKVDYGYQLQLRFAVLNPTAEQDDEFPPSLVLKVNNRPVTLPAQIPSNYPGTPPRQPSKPLNITSQSKLRPIGMVGPRAQPPNSVIVSWQPDIMGRNWVVCLNLVKKLTSADLFKRMKDKGYMQPSVTGKLIDSIMKVEDVEMAPTNLKVSVACPVGKSRMEYPCRSKACSHIQCFDALLYLQMNEKKPVWSCPVCNKKILYEDLEIDGFFIEVIKELPSSANNDIEINPDGSWKQIEDKVDKERESHAQNSQAHSRPAGNGNGNATGADIETISIDDDSDNEGSSKENPTKSLLVKSLLAEPLKPIPATLKSAPATIETISLSDSDDEQAGPSPPQSTTTSQPTTTNTNSIEQSNLVISSVTSADAPKQSALPPPKPKPSGSSLATPAMPDDDDIICLSD